jgi:hypothetical protein
MTLKVCGAMKCKFLRARVVPIIRWRSSQLKWPASEKVPHSLLTLDFD